MAFFYVKIPWVNHLLLFHLSVLSISVYVRDLLSVEPTVGVL